MILTFKDLPEDYFDVLEEHGTQSTKSYSIEHICQRATDNSIDNLEWELVSENRSHRIMGSKNKICLERIGNGAKYSERDTKRRKKAIVEKDNKHDYDSMLDEYEEFIDMYK